MLPEGWNSVNLGVLAEYITSGSRGWAKYYSENGAAFLRVQNLRRRNVNLNWNDVQRVAPPHGAEGARTKLQPLDILVTITADLGRIGLFDSTDEAFVNQHVALVRLVLPDIAPFVSRFLLTEAAQRQLGLRDRGVTRAGLGLDDLRAVEVPIAPSAEQLRIVSKLDALTIRLVYARAELSRSTQLTKKFREHVVTAAFDGSLTGSWRGTVPQHSADTDAELDQRHVSITRSKRRKPSAKVDWKPNIELPPHWRWVSIDSITAAADYGTSAKTSSAEGDVPVLRMGNLQNGEIDWSNLKFLPGDHPSLSGLMLQEGDVLFNRTNSFELVGKTAIFRGYDQSVSFASYIIRLRPCGILPGLLTHYLNSSFARQWVEAVASQQVGQANVNGTKLKALGIPLPPPDEQSEMLRLLDDAHAHAHHLEAEATRAQELLDRLEVGILTKAFRGELVPQDPADASSSVLLDSIDAQRTGAPKRRNSRNSG